MSNPRENETQRQYHTRRALELQSIRSPWEAIWRPLGNYFEPSRLRLDDKNEGFYDRSKIIDSSPTFSLRTLASGMHSGVSSPARPWFQLATHDPELRKYEPVKVWLDDVETRMREAFQSSNIYRAFHKGYADLGQFGQSCGLLVEDDENHIRMMQQIHGRFWIARDENGRATTLYRKFKWTVEKIVSRFGLENVSDTVRTQYDNANYDSMFYIWHAVEPRLNRNPKKADKKNKRFLSNYWEDHEPSNGKMLEESGFDSNPIIAPPWELSGDDEYAVSPAMVVLGDAKMLQKEQSRKLEGIDKIVRPPMTGPTALKNNPASLLPGSVTYVDDPAGKGYRPAMEVNIRLGELREDIRETRDRINQGMYSDLFLMLANMEGIQPRNSMEIAERKEEKLLALGPVLENIYDAQLEPVISRAFEIMLKRNQFPPAPPEIQNQDLKIEYTSILAQAQKAVATGAIERVAGFVGNLANAKPDVLDRFDADEAVTQYSEMVGAPAKIIKSNDEVKKVRDERSAQMQQAAQLETAEKAVPVAKGAAETAGLMAEAASMPGGQDLLSQLGISGA